MIEIGCQLIHISCVKLDSPGSGAGLLLLGRTAPGLAFTSWRKVANGSSRGEKKEISNQPHPNSVSCDSFAI
jgi:hypothetical protein